MDPLFQIVLLLLKILRAIIRPIIVFVSKGKRKVLPPLTNDLLRISATDLAEKIRRKQLSSEEICKAYIDRIKKVNTYLNAVVEDRFQMAMLDARNVDKYLLKCALNEEELKKTKPLLGVPLTVKESCGVQGLERSVGQLASAGVKAVSDGEIVSRLRASGAIPLLVSNTPELCLSTESFNLITGRTNNPFDTTCTSGGSSGGEGALLGAGASIIGIGSDIAGSIRIPALYNGVYGHKPTPRIASIKGHYPNCQDAKYSDFLVIGPMTRYAQDLKLVFAVMVDPNQKTKLRLHKEVDLSELNIFFMDDANNFVLPSTQKEIRDAVKTAAKYLAVECGSKVNADTKFPVKDVTSVCGQYLYSIEDIPNPLKAIDTNLEMEFFKGLFGYSKYTTNLTFFFIQKKIMDACVNDRSKELSSWGRTITDILGDNGVFLYPTFGATASKHNEYIFTSLFMGYTIFTNAFKLPATAIPCGLDKDGMPFGIQIIAGPYQDRLCLAVAEQLEKCFGGWQPPN